MRTPLGAYTIRFDSIMPVIRRSELLKARLDRFSRVLQGVENGDITALHRARVASRRLRELLPVLQLDYDVAVKLNRRLRRVTARLGTVRELDVLLLLIDELHVSRRVRLSAKGRVGRRCEDLCTIAGGVIQTPPNGGERSPRKAAAEARLVAAARRGRDVDVVQAIGTARPDKDAVRQACHEHMPPELEQKLAALRTTVE